MKTKSTLGLATLILLTLTGCATQHRGPAYGLEREFRQQVEQSEPVKGWGYTVHEIRFSADYHKALVVFDIPGKISKQDVVLEDDGFRRYKGSLLSSPDADNPAALPQPGSPGWRRAFITVTLPNK